MECNEGSQISGGKLHNEITFSGNYTFLPESAPADKADDHPSCHRIDPDDRDSGAVFYAAL
jgi:hypothetical protein